MKALLKIIPALFFAFSLHAQNFPATIAKADELFRAARYSEAFPLYQELLKKDPLNALLNYKIGLCYLQSRSQKNKSLLYLEKAIEFTPALTHNADAKNTDAPVDAYKLLGDAYCYNYKFDLAISAYEKYKSLMTEKKLATPELLSTLNNRIETCKFGKDLKELVALPVKIKTDKPSNPDTTFKPYSSSLSKDKSTLTFTFKVPVSKIEKLEDAAYYEDLKIKPDTFIQKNQVVRASASPMPDTIAYATTIGSSVDGQIILTYKNEGSDGNLYISRLHNNVWSQPFKINRGSNPTGWEMHECLSPDGNTMYFVSDRPGGYGGKDIYRCVKLEDGSWSKAVNLGPLINSAYDDEAPFIHPDGKTLFFSSNRNKPKEYFENFVVGIVDGKPESRPVVTGYPLDKSKDNSYYEVAADKKKIYTPVETDKKKLKQMMIDSARQKEAENFLITFINEKKSPLTLMKGTTLDAQSKLGIPAEITVSNNETGALEGVYHADAGTGFYSFILPSGTNNNITIKAAGKIFYSQNFRLNNQKDYFEKNAIVQLEPIAKKSKVTLNNIFFEENSAQLQKSSDIEINNIYELLRENPTVFIQLHNDITSNTNKKFYKRLSKSRAESVKEILVKKGIREDRITVNGTRQKFPKKAIRKNNPQQLLELEITAVK